MADVSPGEELEEVGVDCSVGPPVVETSETVGKMVLVTGLDTFPMISGVVTRLGTVNNESVVD